MHSRGEEFGPFPLELVREKLAAGHVGRSTWVTVIEDGKRISETGVADVIALEDGKTRANPASGEVAEQNDE